MNNEQLDFFRQRLLALKGEITRNALEAADELREAAAPSDEADRATLERNTLSRCVFATGKTSSWRKSSKLSSVSRMAATAIARRRVSLSAFPGCWRARRQPCPSRRSSGERGGRSCSLPRLQIRLHDRLRSIDNQEIKTSDRSSQRRMIAGREPTQTTAGGLADALAVVGTGSPRSFT